MAAEKMTKGERAELGQLIRKRERVMKADAAQRGAEMLAEFDQKSAAIYSFDDDANWAKAEAEARTVVQEANKLIQQRAKELGIPEQFSPGLYFSWQGRGENASKARRAELRRVAVSRIDALLLEAKTKIERMALAALTEVVANGLESAAAKDFLEKMPALTALMPSLDVLQINAQNDQSHERKQRQEY